MGKNPERVGHRRTYRSVLPALGSLRQKHHDFEANLSYAERPYLKEQTVELGMDVRGCPLGVREILGLISILAIQRVCLFYIVSSRIARGM